MRCLWRRSIFKKWCSLVSLQMQSAVARLRRSMCRVLQGRRSSYFPLSTEPRSYSGTKAAMELFLGGYDYRSEYTPQSVLEPPRLWQQLLAPVAERVDAPTHGKAMIVVITFMALARPRSSSHLQRLGIDRLSGRRSTSSVEMQLAVSKCCGDAEAATVGDEA